MQNWEKSKHGAEFSHPTTSTPAPVHQFHSLYERTTSRQMPLLRANSQHCLRGSSVNRALFRSKSVFRKGLEQGWSRQSWHLRRSQGQESNRLGFSRFPPGCHQKCRPSPWAPPLGPPPQLPRSSGGSVLREGSRGSALPLLLAALECRWGSRAQRSLTPQGPSHRAPVGSQSSTPDLSSQIRLWSATAHPPKRGLQAGSPATFPHGPHLNLVPSPDAPRGPPPSGWRGLENPAWTGTFHQLNHPGTLRTGTFPMLSLPLARQPE